VAVVVQTCHAVVPPHARRRGCRGPSRRCGHRAPTGKAGTRRCLGRPEPLAERHAVDASARPARRGATAPLGTARCGPPQRCPGAAPDNVHHPERVGHPRGETQRRGRPARRAASLHSRHARGGRCGHGRRGPAVRGHGRGHAPRRCRSRRRCVRTRSQRCARRPCRPVRRRRRRAWLTSRSRGRCRDHREPRSPRRGAVRVFR
jgi:hypothetical protein